jgi:predicted RNase H-like nuclease (RuvC/YqgF family)
MGMKIEPDERRMDERLTEVADYLLDKSNGGEHRMVQSVRDAIQENKELRITKDALHDTLIQREQTHSDCRKRLASKKSKAESLKRAIDFQTATIAHLEAERDGLREVVDKAVAWFDNSNHGRDWTDEGTFEPRDEDIDALADAVQDYKAALSASQNGEGVGDE